MSASVEQGVQNAVASWLRWLPTWTPGTARGRVTLCRRCVGSPLVLAAGFPDGVPHQIRHALITRLQRIIDRTVDDVIQESLPSLHQELISADDWAVPGGYDPNQGLPPESEGLPVDPILEPGEQPFLFTLSELAEVTSPPPALPRPPLSAEEKQRLREEIERADQVAFEAGNLVCFALTSHRAEIQRAIAVFVDPVVQDLLNELSTQLEAPE